MGLFETVRNEAIAVFEDFANHAAYLFEGKTTRAWDRRREEVVMLLHGYLQGDAAFRNLEEFIMAHGFNTENEAYPFWQDLKEVEELTLEKALRIHKRIGAPIHMVGHSLGGIVARAVAGRRPDIFRTVVTLGAPHGGTWMAYAGYPTRSAQQMIPGSRYLEELNGHPLPRGIRFYSMYSSYDYLVVPSRSGFLPGATNIEVGNVSHVGLIGVKSYKILLDMLQGKFDPAKLNGLRSGRIYPPGTRPR